MRDSTNVKAPPSVIYAQLKFIAANEKHEDSLKYLRNFTTSLAHDLQAEEASNSGRGAVTWQKHEELSKLLARCYFKQGVWQKDLLGSSVWSDVRRPPFESTSRSDENLGERDE